MNVTALLFFFLSRPQYLLGSYHVNVFPHKVLYNTYSAWALQAYYPTIQAQVLSKPHIKSELEENSAAASTKLVYTSLFISWNSVLWLKLRRQLHTCDSVPNSENDLLTQWRKAVVSFCCVLFKVFDRKKDMIQYFLEPRYYTAFLFFRDFVHCNKWTRSMWKSLKKMKAF